MKTLIKSIKAITFIFLVFAISSCQDELVESQDNSLSSVNQDAAKGKGVAYTANLVDGGFGGIESKYDGQSSSKDFSIGWDVGCRTSCPTAFTLTMDDGSSKDFHNAAVYLRKKGKKITAMQIWLHDADTSFATDVFTFGPVPFPEVEDEVIITVDEVADLWRYSKYGQGKKVEKVATIKIGDMVYTRE